MDIDVTNQSLIVVGAGRKVAIYITKNGKFVRSHALGEGPELTRVTMDPSGLFFAVATADRTVLLVDFYSGAVLASVSGHSEAITAIAFTNDCRRLISTGADGCIMVWRIAPRVVRAMQDRLAEINSVRANRVSAGTPASRRPPVAPVRLAAAPDVGAVSVIYSPRLDPVALSPTRVNASVSVADTSSATDGDSVSMMAMSMKGLPIGSGGPPRLSSPISHGGPASLRASPDGARSPSPPPPPAGPRQAWAAAPEAAAAPGAVVEDMSGGADAAASAAAAAGAQAAADDEYVCDGDDMEDAVDADAPQHVAFANPAVVSDGASSACVSQRACAGVCA